MTIRIRAKIFIVCCTASALLACSGDTSVLAVECDPGYLDINGECKLLCQEHEDCVAGEMCSDSGYCIDDDGSRCSEDNCGICDNDSTNDCVQDCAGTWGGTAAEDACGVCDDDPTNDCVEDCSGTFGGTSAEDECGVCDDDPTNDCVEDCAGMWGGTAVVDDCGICDDDTANDNTTCEQDCAGTWGGVATVDECGVCDDQAANDCVQDCAGVWGGASVFDECGACDDDVSNDCVQDCAGAWGGGATVDACGSCDEDPSNDCQEDCAGVPGGLNYVDDCGVCDSDVSNDNASCVQDCAGVWGGTSYTDDCGMCDADESNDNGSCLQDCAGTWDGTATTDECGVCDDDSSNDNSTCTQDCSGSWGGTAVADACGVCDSDSSNDDVTCTDCAGVVNGDAVLDRCGLCGGDGTGCEAIELIIDADAYVSSSNSSSNYGSSTELIVDPGNNRTFLRFDVSTIPPGATVSSAALEAHAFAGFAWGGNGNVYTYLVEDDSWDESGITWNNQPDVSGDALGDWWLWYDSTPADKTGRFESEALASAVATQAEGDGVISLRLSSPGYRTNYHSSEASSGGSYTLDTTITSTTSNQGGCSSTVTRSCPAGMVAVGYSGQTGGWFDHLHLICQTLNGDGSVSGSKHYTDQIGSSSSGNESGDKLCPDGRVMVGAYVRAGNHMDYLQGLCKYGSGVGDGNSNASNTTAPGMGNSGGGSDRGIVHCPDGQVVTGVTSSGSFYPCNVQWECTSVASAGAAPTLEVWFIDCHGDFGGSAFISAEGQCVGGNTGL